MMISSTAEFGARAITVAFDSNDAISVVGEESWAAMSFKERVEWLQKKADIEVLIYLFKEGHITQDYLVERVKEIKAR